MGGGSNIILNGVSPNQVLFYFPGTQSINTNGNSDTAGIFLAPTGSFTISGGVHDTEFISGAKLTFQSAPKVNQIPPCT